MKEILDADVAAALNKFSKVAVAVSGGRDSMALLHAIAFSGRYKGGFFVINVNHNLRGKRGEEDSLFVRGYCEKHGIECAFYDEDVPAEMAERGAGAEQCARDVRRRIFSETVASGRADRVLTAHHASDVTESVLMHIFRGSGIGGIKGIKRDDGVLFRPLIRVSKADIDGYIGENAIPYVEDETNGDDGFYRNYLRLKVIPGIKEIYPALDCVIASLAAAAEEADRCLSELCVKPEARDGEVFLDEKAFSMPAALVSRSVLLALEAADARVDAERVHIDGVIALKDKKTGARVCLRHGIVAEKRRGGVAVFKYKEFSDKEREAEFPFGEGRFSFADKTVEVSSGGGALAFDADAVPEGSVFRLRRIGDRFRRFGGGDKSLGDFLTDVKCPASRRDGLVVLACGGRVLAVPEYDISDEIKVTPETVRKRYLSVFPAKELK